ncbi:MAG TPA: hypothetical protein VF884_13490 [Nitrososphaeraceae archaeon]
MTSENEYLEGVREDNKVAAKDEQDPVMCIKCNKAFESDSEYMQHYDEVHKLDDRT